MAQVTPSALAVANQDEALHCVDLAVDFMKKLQFEKAVRFCQKAVRLSPGTPAAAAAARLQANAERELASGRAPRVAEAGGGAMGSRNPNPAAAASSAQAPPREQPRPDAQPQQQQPQPQPQAGHAAGPAGAAAGPSFSDRAALRVFRYLERCGILPSYHLPIVAVYSAIAGLLLYRLLSAGFGSAAPVPPRRAAAGRAVDHTGLSLWGLFLPGDVVYSAPGVYFCAPFATMAAVSYILSLLSARRARA
eukprot:TRINITY_DN3661_c0_g2_i1.p1 TRINITY_DN3661_c0_g2~~TRINITY_DN3661_c0_g2_i1.p1  ORF type:complete len:266 (+),score=54.14 TRINITY_DN3661_c0_g2_i1:52-798(+)